jgi:hypothetical protein
VGKRAKARSWGVSCGEIFVQSFDAALEKTAAIFRYRGGRLGSISSNGCPTRRSSPVKVEKAWSAR